MKHNAEDIHYLSRYLFWDVDFESVKFDENAAFVIDRVLSMGTMDDFKILKAYYGKSKILEIAKQFRYLDDRVLHFCSAYFDTPLTEFRCYTNRQLNQTHWNY